MQLTHKIALDATPEQAEYFKQAAGTARFVWNWGLAEWHKQFAAGKKPNAMALKKQFNQIKYAQYPWLTAMHRDSHAQPFTYLGKAWSRFFNNLKVGERAFEPRFKIKGESRESFYVANDKFRLEGINGVLPKVGRVQMCEELRFTGKILGATISKTGNRWFIAIQVDIPEYMARQKRLADGTIGVDLGLTTAATISNGEKINSPRPLKTALRRLQIRGRQLSRKIKVAKKVAGFAVNVKLPSGTRLPISNNRKKTALKLAVLHARITNIRADFTHKLTTRLCRENQAVVIEDLHIKGMLANDRLARAISDVGFGRIRQQLEYKSKRFGTQLIIADRWYPSTRLCSHCSWKNEALTLKERMWTCNACNHTHDRDLNAAINLKRLATATALPVANQLVTEGTLLSNVS